MNADHVRACVCVIDRPAARSRRPPTAVQVDGRAHREQIWLGGGVRAVHHGAAENRGVEAAGAEVDVRACVCINDSK